MTSKEQEYELRAQALKRLAFVIFSSKRDQYCAGTSLQADIQGRFLNPFF
jgi:hypothetical protein